MKKIKITKKPKTFLYLAGLSIAVFIFSVVLHNFFYALGVVTRHRPIFPYVFEALHVLFFFVAVPIAPLGFIIGILGAIILFIKSKINI